MATRSHSANGNAGQHNSDLDLENISPLISGEKELKSLDANENLMLDYPENSSKSLHTELLSATGGDSGQESWAIPYENMQNSMENVSPEFSAVPEQKATYHEHINQNLEPGAPNEKTLISKFYVDTPQSHMTVDLEESVRGHNFIKDGEGHQVHDLDPVDFDLETALPAKTLGTSDVCENLPDSGDTCFGGQNARETKNVGPVPSSENTNRDISKSGHVTGENTQVRSSDPKSNQPRGHVKGQESRFKYIHGDDLYLLVSLLRQPISTSEVSKKI